MELNTIKTMERIARSSENIISLGQGIPSDALNDTLQQAAIRATVYGVADAYSDPQGIPELRQAISGSIKSEGMIYAPEEIVVTVGAIEAINVALRSAISKTRKQVIVPTPTYSAYFSLVTLANGEVVNYETKRSQGWNINISEIEQLITSETAAILLSNPNNPTGTVYDKTTLNQLAELAQDAGIPLIIDEVYRHMTFEKQFYSPAENAAYKNTIIRIMSFSKDFNMTGWRIGYIQTARSRITSLVSIHDTLVNCAPVISQYVALAALQNADTILSQNHREYKRRRDQMADWLDKCSHVMSYDLPDAGYFFFPRLKRQNNSQFIANELAANGVVVIPGSAFGDAGEGHLRLCFGRSKDAIDGAMNRIECYYDAK